MKLKIERILKPLTEKTGNSSKDGKPWKMSWTAVDGKLDGKAVAGATVKAWNGDAKRIVVGAELDVEPDERSTSGNSYVVSKRKALGNDSGGGYRGMDKMQFLLDQNAKLAIAALAGAVEMVKGTPDKVIPLATQMHTWLREKSMIVVQEEAAKGGEG